MPVDLHDTYFHVPYCPSSRTKSCPARVSRSCVRAFQTHLFERQLRQPRVVQYLFAACVGRVSYAQIQLARIEATVLAHALLRLEHAGAGVASAGAQLQLLHAAGTAESARPARVLHAGLLAGQAQRRAFRVQSLQISRLLFRLPAFTHTHTHTGNLERLALPMLLAVRVAEQQCWMTFRSLPCFQSPLSCHIKYLLVFKNLINTCLVFVTVTRCPRQLNPNNV